MLICGACFLLFLFHAVIELETGLDTLWTTATSKDTFIDNVVSLGSNISETNVVALLSRHLKDTNQTTLSAIEYSSRRFHQHISTFYANLYVEVWYYYLFLFA